MGCALPVLYMEIVTYTKGITKNPLWHRLALCGGHTALYKMPPPCFLDSPRRGTNTFFNDGVDTPLNGVDTTPQIQRQKKLGQQVDAGPEQVDTGLSSQNSLFAELGQQVDTASEQVDTRPRSQNSLFSIWDSVSTPPPGCNKPGHMKGECPKNKKEKHKKFQKFKKPKAMVATWSDEDSSEEEEDKKSSSSESEEICFMANNSGEKKSKDSQKILSKEFNFSSKAVSTPSYLVSTHTLGQVDTTVFQCRHCPLARPF
ncbi:hypothetical protein Taro_047357 [Colocasia esculenta]|uniref:Uncharacterized protein n=1 Tax=Colocasia esculenta TaxID=4460 RepID=A0A843X6L1_COLES|nr:hypothetical protein [Colocasia esculenta]